MTKPEWFLLLDILDIIAARLPHGGSDTKPERELRDKLENIRREVKRMPW